MCRIPVYPLRTDGDLPHRGNDTSGGTSPLCCLLTTPYTQGRGITRTAWMYSIKLKQTKPILTAVIHMAELFLSSLEIVHVRCEESVPYLYYRLGYHQCCVGSGIRCFFDPWIMARIRDGIQSRSTIRDRDKLPGFFFLRTYCQFFVLKIIIFFNADRIGSWSQDKHPGSTTLGTTYSLDIRALPVGTICCVSCIY